MYVFITGTTLRGVTGEEQSWDCKCFYTSIQIVQRSSVTERLQAEQKIISVFFILFLTNSSNSPYWYFALFFL